MTIVQEKNQEKRLQPRVSYRQAVRYKVGEFDCMDGSLSRDISEGGLCLNVSRFIPIKEKLIIYLQEDSESTQYEVKANVSWVRILPGDEQYQVGVQFSGINEPIRQQINRIISLK